MSDFRNVRLYTRRDDNGGTEYEEATDLNGLPVRVMTSVTALGYTLAYQVSLPITTQGSAYTANDALGAIFSIPVPTSGVIQSAMYIDTAAQAAAATEFWLFNAQLVTAADNAAFAVAVVDAPKFEGIISFATTNSFSASNVQVYRLDAIAKSYVAPLGRLWIQGVTRGTPTIAAGTSPSPLFSMRIIPDGSNDGVNDVLGSEGAGSIVT